MLIDLGHHAKKRTVILAIEPISIHTVCNGNANNRSDQKVLHIRLRPANAVIFLPVAVFQGDKSECQYTAESGLSVLLKPLTLVLETAS